MFHAYYAYFCLLAGLFAYWLRELTGSQHRSQPGAECAQNSVLVVRYFFNIPKNETLPEYGDKMLGGNGTFKNLLSNPICIIFIRFFPLDVSSIKLPSAMV